MGLIKNIFKKKESKDQGGQEGNESQLIPKHLITKNQQHTTLLDHVHPPPPHHDYKLEDFEVRRTLGVGSFGRVQLVYHTPTLTFYAMKRLKKTEIIKQRQVEHTNNERALLAKTTWVRIEGTPENTTGHPFLVKTICSFQDSHFLYIIMEYVSGGELFSLLRKVKVHTLSIIFNALYTLHLVDPATLCSPILCSRSGPRL